MHRFTSVSLVAASVMLLGGCGPESPVAPVGDHPSPTVSAISGQGLSQVATPAPRYIVAYHGNAPRGLESAVEAAGGNVDAVYDKYGFAVVSGISDSDVSGLAALQGVTEAAAEPMFKLGEPSRRPLGATAPASPANPSAAAFITAQWHLLAISAPEAWMAGRLGSKEVTVAVLDTGIDPTHPDIFGLVDLSRSAVFDETDIQFIDLFYPGQNLDPLTDIHLHGTHVASIIASNAFLGAGVTSQTTLMAVKVCNVTDACPGAAVFEGLAHAIENGADVINMSLGGGFDKAGAQGFGSVINRLFNAANQAGVTVVVAAGNDAADLDHNGSVFATYCDAPHVICVSATAPLASDNLVFGPWFEIDAPASYSNFGRSAISVAAPGGDAAGFVVSACSQFSLLLDCSVGIPLVLVAGTSQAAPAVSGLAALLVEDLGRSPSRIAAAIRKGADDLGEPGVDPFYGHGRINIPRTLGVD